VIALDTYPPAPVQRLTIVPRPAPAPIVAFLVCSSCGSEDVTMRDTSCPECGADPDLPVRPCPECQDINGGPTGSLRYATDRSGRDDYEATCPSCDGRCEEPAPFWGYRQELVAALGVAS
jgi:hypothetical protein